VIVVLAGQKMRQENTSARRRDLCMLKAHVQIASCTEKGIAVSHFILSDPGNNL
jgi:hypothetical protein